MEEDIIEGAFEEEEMVVDDDDDDIIILSSDEEIEVEAPVEEKDDSLKILKNRFNPRNQSELRLLLDYQRIQITDPKKLGFVAFPQNENLMIWEVRLYCTDEKNPLYQDLIEYNKIYKRDYVEMNFHFPKDYPMNPPFVRVIQPRFAFHTGRVTIGGSLCTDVLTSSGWNCLYDIETLMVNIASEMLASNPRIDFRNQTKYSLEDAFEAYRRVASDHGWKVPSWNPLTN